VEAGRLVQGLLDAEREQLGFDEATPLANACGRAMYELALGRAPDFGEMLRSVSLPARVELKVPEGYAFYAVYPQLYADAAAPGSGLQTVGIRSIGTSLAAAVAVRCGGPPALSVRPVGHPFRRELRLGPKLESALRRGGEFAVVDEGPGLSGSSFLCVARALLSRGVPASSIHLFPSHPGPPGPHAGPEDRALWERLPRRWHPFESLLQDLPRFCEDLARGTGPLQDLSGGAWRDLHVGPRPPANPGQERRKYLLLSERGMVLLKFAGLGRSGDETLRRAQAIADAGFAPPVLGLRNGFLVERWVDRAREPQPSPALLERVAQYVAFRSRRLPAAPGAGARPGELLRMARHNAREALGESAARGLARWESRLSALAEATHRIETDNRMHRWEWLQLPSGVVLKADGADHCRAHDLVGCQDAAWDLAAAAVELDLDEAALVSRFRAHGGAGAQAEALEFSRHCYLAFQLGYWSMAAQALAAMPEESGRLHAAAQRYRALLATELAAA
jgi:hypothetical protein